MYKKDLSLWGVLILLLIAIITILLVFACKQIENFNHDIGIKYYFINLDDSTKRKDNMKKQCHHCTRHRAIEGKTVSMEE